MIAMNQDLTKFCPPFHPCMELYSFVKSKWICKYVTLFWRLLSIFVSDLRQTIKQEGGTEQIYLSCSDCCSYHFFVFSFLLSLFWFICFFIYGDYSFLEAYIPELQRIFFEDIGGYWTHDFLATFGVNDWQIFMALYS